MQLQLSLALADDLHHALLLHGEPLDASEAARLLVASPSVPAALTDDILAVLIHDDQRFCWGSDGESGLRHPDRRSVSLRRWEAPDPELIEVPFVALDLETTGARAGVSKITEVGAVRIEGFREVKRFSTLVNPMRPIPPMITQITGITQEMVADAPRIEEVIPEFLEFLKGAVVVAHNASFDVGFLNYELRRLKGRQLGDGAIDTLPLARALAPGLPNYRLHTVADALGAPVSPCHRALADAQAAGHVFVTLVERLRERGVTRLGECRAYVSPSSRSTTEKLSLTRDLPRAPGAYRFVDREGRILYVGKADRLRERVRSYFVPSADHTRKVRQAIRLVERIEWDETLTTLEAVVREQQLILEHRPSCNLHGRNPESYAYVKAGGAGYGLSLYTTCRAPKWLSEEGEGPLGTGGRRRDSRARQVRAEARLPVVLGPFRGRARLGAALELLQHCYPIRRCPRRPDCRPCIRSEGGHCLAPCVGEPGARIAHDDLVLQIVDWLAGGSQVELSDPFERADQLMSSLSRQRRYEEAQHVRDSSEHLASIRRSYRALVEASSLSFAALWPEPANGDGPSVRMNLVWNGRLRESVSLHAAGLEEEIGTALVRLRDHIGAEALGARLPPYTAVPQKDLDMLLAVRRWFHEDEKTPKIPIPNQAVAESPDGSLRLRLAAQASRVLFEQSPS